MDFKRWLLKLEAVQTHKVWDDEHIPNTPAKDILGIPKLKEPGFRKSDKILIDKHTKTVESYLDNATGRLGVHWVIMYLEPPRGVKETPTAGSVRQMKQAGQAEWKPYHQYAMLKADQQIRDFGSQGVLPPPNPQNTIVYVKPTSRVQGMSDWQSIHNIGHAIWGRARKGLAKFVKMLRQLIFDMQQKHHDSSGKKAQWAEMVVCLARLLDIKSYQRLFALCAGDLDDPKCRINTALNSFMEAMFELVAVYLKNKGTLPLRPRGPVRDVPDRRTGLDPSAEHGIEINRKFGVRDWVWKDLVLTADEWQTASQGLTTIIDEAIRDCVYAKAGPIYATEGYFTTEP